MRSFIRLGVPKGQAYACFIFTSTIQSPKAYAGGASQIIFCPMNRRILPVPNLIREEPYVRWCERCTGYHLVVSRLFDYRQTFLLIHNLYFFLRLILFVKYLFLLNPEYLLVLYLVNIYISFPT